MTSKIWYMVSVMAAVLFTAACTSLDHVSNYRIYDLFWEPIAIALIVACLLMLIAGFLWSRVGEPRSVVRAAVLNVFTPIVLAVVAFIGWPRSQHSR